MAKLGTINGIGVRASALTPIYYKQGCGRDLLADYSAMQTTARRLVLEREDGDASGLSYIDLEFVSCLFWSLAYGADKEKTPATWQEFIDQFDDPFSVYELWAEIVSFWTESTETTSTAKN